MTTIKKEPWIGLVELSGSPECPVLNGCEGAFSTYIVSCENSTEFRMAAAMSAKDLDLVIENIIWSEPLRRRIKRYDLEECLEKIAFDVKQGGDGRYGPFHVWDEKSQ